MLESAVLLESSQSWSFNPFQNECIDSLLEPITSLHDAEFLEAYMNDFIYLNHPYKPCASELEVTYFMQSRNDKIYLKQQSKAIITEF